MIGFLLKEGPLAKEWWDMVFVLLQKLRQCKCTFVCVPWLSHFCQESFSKQNADNDHVTDNDSST